MTVEEMKERITNKTKVKYLDIEYIPTALIYRKNTIWNVSIELLDTNNNSVTIADIKRIKEIWE